MISNVNTSGADTSNKVKEAEVPACERELVRQAAAGDEAAFGELVKMYHERLYAVVYGFVQHREDALEVCQQVWLKAWRKMHTFHGKARFFTWLYRVASFTCMDFARKKAHARQVPLMEGVEPVRTVNDPVAPSMFSRPDKEARRREIRNVFNRALQELSPEHRMALVLREVEGLSYEEIAKVMKCRRGTVMSRIFNARKKMQSYLEDV